jgi:DNA-binding GntR family transcriptional regulator
MPREALVTRSPLSDQIKDRLLQQILAGEYPPGSRIVETRVARELGTSQAPVREAIRDLEGLGVLEISAFRGARVRHPSKAELLEAYGIRAELESLGARLALPHISDDDLDELNGYVEEMQRAADAGDPHAEAVADVAFHARIIEISGNNTLKRVWTYLEPLSRTYISLVSPGVNVRHAADLHIPILAALRDHDPDLATAAYHEHFDSAGATFQETWIDDPAASNQASNADTPPGRGVRSAPRPNPFAIVAEPSQSNDGRGAAARSR